MKTKGQLAYEADVSRRPTYHDGAKRKTWDQLGEIEQWSWQRDPKCSSCSPLPPAAVARKIERLSLVND